jgi:S-adenosylmethionine decarboxylase
MRHVMLDLYGCDPYLLADEAHLRRTLDEYPARIGMEKVSTVELRDIKTSNPLDDGYSGFVIIATSHVSLHAWPPYGMINIDVFSCNEFDEAEVVSFARAMFNPIDVEVNSVLRATRSQRPSTFSRAMRETGAGTSPERTLYDSVSQVV